MPFPWDKTKTYLKIFILAVVSVFLVLITIDVIKSDFLNEYCTGQSGQDLNENRSFSEEESDNCNVRGIEVYDDLVTHIPNSSYDTDGNIIEDLTASDRVAYTIRQADEDEDIKAILVEIDSYGGYPVAGQEIAEALKKATKPTVAFIRGGGASAAYMAATGAKRIFASENSDVGGIGVTMSYLDFAKQNQDEGITYVALSSGKFKDAGDPDKALTEEEKELFMRDINIVHENYVRMIAQNRNLEISKVNELADGSTMLGRMALEKGLIDQLGGIFEVEEYLKSVIGEKAEICW